MDTKKMIPLIMTLMMAQNVHSAYLSEDQALLPIPSSSSVTSSLPSASKSILLSKPKDKELKYETDEKTSEEQIVSLELDDLWGFSKKPKRDEDKFRAWRIAHFMGFSLFDGHGGDRAAIKAADAFPLAFYKVWKKVKGDKGQLKIQEALDKTFVEVDKQIESNRSYSVFDWFLKRHVEENDESGTTALVVLFDLSDKDYSFYVANAGNSRSIGFMNGKTVVLSKDHVASDEEERKRILAAGGVVENRGPILGWRVGMRLANSRGLGDSSIDEAIIPNPEIRTLSLTDIHEKENNYIVMASDGYTESVLRDHDGDVESDFDKRTIFRLNESFKNHSDKTLSNHSEYMINQIKEQRVPDDTTFLLINLSKIKNLYTKKGVTTT